mmetsp:Transcript_49000/g.116592  ORF Transcript_49000/g.116592 Transcript_49000/m.116592 type:complete len:447 (+) Transcript_49000:1661-3001(+)
MIAWEPHLLGPRRGQLQGEGNSLDGDHEQDHKDHQREDPNLAHLLGHHWYVKFLEEGLYKSHRLLLDFVALRWHHRGLPLREAGAKTSLGLQAPVPHQKQRRKVRQRQHVDHDNAGGREPSASPHGHCFGHRCGCEGCRCGEGSVEDGDAGTLIRQRQDFDLLVFGEPATSKERVFSLDNVAESVFEHENVISPDTKNQVDHQDVEEFKVEDPKDSLINERCHWQAHDHHEQAGGCEEAGFCVEPHNDEYQSDCHEGQHEVRNGHFLDLVDAGVREAHSDIAGSNEAIFITLEGGFKKAICQAQVVKGRLDHRLSLIWHDIYLQKGPAVGALLGLWKIGVNKPCVERLRTLCDHVRIRFLHHIIHVSVCQLLTAPVITCQRSCGRDRLQRRICRRPIEEAENGIHQSHVLHQRVVDHGLFQFANACKPVWGEQGLDTRRVALVEQE